MDANKDQEEKSDEISKYIKFRALCCSGQCEPTLITMGITAAKSDNGRQTA